MNVVERVQYECKKKKIPISRLERECGFSNGYIRNLREGKIPADRLQIIADYLKVPYLYLLNGKPEITADKLFAGVDYVLPELTITEEERELLRAYRDVPETTKDIIRKILDIREKEGSESLTEVG